MYWTKISRQGGNKGIVFAQNLSWVVKFMSTEIFQLKYNIGSDMVH